MPKKVQKVFNQVLYDLVKEKYLNLIDRKVKKSKMYAMLKTELAGQVKPFDVMVYYQMLCGKNFEEAVNLAGYIASRR